MATAARDRLARTLRGDAQTAFSIELKASTDDLSLEVEGFGHVKFPVTPAKARKLLALGQPARFGRGEETVTDPDVRDTWEIPKRLVRAEWNEATLKDVLATVKEELGLPNAAELTADLHSLLVYETNQHFLAHQDSEKDDSMVGTLVVTLPSSYVGGELMVGHNEEWKAYRGSKTALSLVAFYADCRHEVLKVKSGRNGSGVARGRVETRRLTGGPERGRLGTCLERLAGAGSAQQAEALEVVAPVEVVDAVIVIGELDRVFLPEPEPGAAVIQRGEHEPEDAVLPGVMPADAAPGQLLLLVEGDDLHHRVEVFGERPLDPGSDRGRGRPHLGRPPARHPVRLGQRGPDQAAFRVDVYHVVDGLHG
jgi:hypothetical protein